MKLVSTDKDPAPAGAQVVKLTAPGGVDLRAARWAEAGPRGTIVFLQGRTEYLEKYFEVYAHWQERGFAVATLDWRGQGLSERPLANRQKGYVDSFDCYLSDLHHFVEEFVVPSCPPPYRLIAHSMGGQVAFRYLHDHPARFIRAAFSSPMWGLPPWRERWSWGDAFTSLTCALGQRRRYVPGFGGDYKRADACFDKNVLTSDRDRFDRMHDQLAAEPDLALGGATFGWIREAFRSIRETRRAGFPEAIATPIRVFSAAADRVVAVAAHRYFGARLPNAEIVTLPGARHELLIESEVHRDRVIAGLDEFFS